MLVHVPFSVNTGSIGPIKNAEVQLGISKQTLNFYSITHSTYPNGPAERTKRSISRPLMRT